MKKSKVTDFPQFPGFPVYFGTHIDNNKVLLKSQAPGGEQTTAQVRDTVFLFPLLKDNAKITVAVFHRNTAATVFEVTQKDHYRNTKHNHSQIRIRTEWVDQGVADKTVDYSGWLRQWPTDIHVTVIGELDVTAATRGKKEKKTKK